MVTHTEPGASRSRNATGLTDSTHSSSPSSAGRYQLDEFDEGPILLYKYRGGLQTSSQKDLCQWLDKASTPSRQKLRLLYADILMCTILQDEKLRVTKKQIPRLQSFVDVKRHDLYLPEEKEMYSDLPNFDSSLASIKIPSTAYWSRLFFGNYDHLYIVSPESTPTSSVADSESRRTSPTSTWGQDSTEDAKIGADHQ
ncbi:hypothetical protein AC579_8188 [Pseudocercospora musae]|uniref:Uncharacterized protein n=1 Tax=Pseudocercospora musae TaxID=113226 RepID=A0A139IUH7_9PEZI|nr:hypothetical protein AC579_8188 [Pseudocercospora musae]